MPARVIAGQKTLLSRDVHEIRYDPVHDEILVMNARAQAVLVFRGGASGEEPPIRVIQGPRTRLVNQEGGGGMDRLDVDPVHNEIFVPSNDSVLVFSREANGDVAPIRAIRGPDTQLNVAKSVAVDPVHNLVVVSNDVANREAVGSAVASRWVQRLEPGSLLIFNRTDDGNAKPRGVIKGPNTQIVGLTHLQVYPPKGWVLAIHSARWDAGNPEGGFEAGGWVGVWTMNEYGDVPPRWRIGGPKSRLMRPRGVVLNPKQKEIIVTDMRANGVLTYYFPELF